MPSEGLGRKRWSIIGKKEIAERGHFIRRLVAEAFPGHQMNEGWNCQVANRAEKRLFKRRGERTRKVGFALIDGKKSINAGRTEKRAG